jgi:hypothetical protein
MKKKIMPSWMTEKFITTYHRSGSIETACRECSIEYKRSVVDAVSIFCPTRSIPVNISKEMYEFYELGNSARLTAEKFGINFSERFRKALSMLGKENKGGNVTHPINKEMVKFYEKHSIGETVKKFNLSPAQAKSLQNKICKDFGHGGKRQGAGRNKNAS